MKSKLILPFACAAGLFIASCTADRQTITFNIKGLGNDTIAVKCVPISKYGKNEPPIEDTILSINGKFHYYLPVDEGAIMTFQPASLVKKEISVSTHPITQFMLLIAEPNDRLKVTGRLRGSNYIEYQVKGSSLMADYVKVRESYATERILHDSLKVQEYYYMFSKKAADMQMKHRDSLIYAIRDERNKLAGEIREKELRYIKNHLSADLSGYLLLYQPYDTVAVYYEQLSESVKTGLFANALDEEYLKTQKYLLRKQAEKSIVEGGTAPNFTLKNLDGEDFSLSSQKGKYVVLDFWGSWCGWCIKGFPKMKEYYAKYKSKVEFIGIACMDKDEKWRKSIKNNELNWLHVIDDESGDVTKNVSAKYAVKGYPTKIILDKDLKIAKIVVGESEEFYEELDKRLK
ncbi:MAG: TlpA family protein disulfide reductase [Prevotellaceae bacterium]|nr:TlpA family protein disulfide reductase [Prevotellaceae bacterium]